jgi:hypothetical protein
MLPQNIPAKLFKYGQPYNTKYKPREFPRIFSNFDIVNVLKKIRNKINFRRKYHAFQCLQYGYARVKGH